MTNFFDWDKDVSDDECPFKTNNEYAKNYNSWRQKEEYNKLKTKYGEHSLDQDENSELDSSSDGTDLEISERLELDFFKTLSSLKIKDPKIYDTNVNFFDDIPIDIKFKKKKKVVKIFLKDYERKLLLEGGGVVSESENEDPKNNRRSRSPTYIEEQQKLKENLQKVAENIEDDNENEWGGMFKVRSKTKEIKDLEESEYKKWLMGQKQHLNNSDIEKNLEPLKQYWNDPKLNKGEQFLRDYILNNRFLDKTNPDHIPTYDEMVHDSDDGLSEDETNLVKQEEFEYKYNYRFEEPDQEFIKRYPRTMEHSLRRTDDKRKFKRAEIKERKLKEKEVKFEEIRKMKELKRKEIQDRIEKLKEITGNTNVAFEDINLEDDFDPEAHDKRMQKLFNYEFYEGEEGIQKPEFPELDEELEIERWDQWEENNDKIQDNLHCEDNDFYMDYDYDANVFNSQQNSSQDGLFQNSKGVRDKRKRKSNFSKAVSQPKPAFDPIDKSYDEYLDEYYKLDCEDVIGDIPCRFKYRAVVPNNFGLTIDEIMKAKDRELNKWCSIKKAVQFRPDHIEKYDVIAYSNRGGNDALKRKLLPSLFENEQNSDDDNKEKIGCQDANEGRQQENEVKGKKNENIARKLLPENAEKKKKGKKKKLGQEVDSNFDISKNNEGNLDTSNNSANNKKKKKKVSAEIGINKNKKSKINKLAIEKQIYEKEEVLDKISKNIQQYEASTSAIIPEKIKKRKKRNKKDNSNKNVEQNKYNDTLIKISGKSKKSMLKKKVIVAKPKKGLNRSANTKSGPDIGISDARLKAFGIKPKKFKNKIKFSTNS